MVITDGLIHGYNCEDNAANTVVTDSVASNDGVASTNTSNLSTTGKIGLAFNFVFANSEFSTTAGANFTRAGIGSVSIWFKTSTGGQSTALYGANSSGFADVRNIDLRTDSGGQIRYNRVDGGTTNLTYNIDYTDNTWRHVVITEDSTNGAALWVDGVKRASNGTSKAFASIGVVPYFGGRNNNGADISHINADIDLVFAWNREITDDEIAEMFNGGAGFDPTATAATVRLIKIAGTFVEKPILTKVSGTFVDKPIKIKIGGSFVDA